MRCLFLQAIRGQKIMRNQVLYRRTCLASKQPFFQAIQQYASGSGVTPNLVPNRTGPTLAPQATTLFTEGTLYHRTLFVSCRTSQIAGHRDLAFRHLVRAILPSRPPTTYADKGTALKYTRRRGSTWRQLKLFRVL